MGLSALIEMIEEILLFLCVHEQSSFVLLCVVFITFWGGVVFHFCHLSHRMMLWKWAEAATCGLVVYLGEKEDNLFKEHLVGNSNTEKTILCVSLVFNCYVFNSDIDYDLFMLGWCRSHHWVLKIIVTRGATSVRSSQRTDCGWGNRSPGRRRSTQSLCLANGADVLTISGIFH